MIIDKNSSTHMDETEIAVTEIDEFVNANQVHENYVDNVTNGEPIENNELNHNGIDDSPK